MAETFTNPIANDGIYKYQGHTTFNGGTINGTPHVIRPKIMDTAVGIETAEDLQGKYSFDVHDIAAKRNREEFAIKFIADLNTKTTNRTTHEYAEDWDGQFAYPDMMLNHLRQRDLTTLAIDHASNIGGRWCWKDLAHGDVLTAMSLVGTTPVTSAGQTYAGYPVASATRKGELATKTYAGKTCICLAFDPATTDYIQGGTAQDVIVKMITLLKAMDYTQRGGNSTSIPLVDSTHTENWYAFLHNTDTKSVHIMFPDLAINVDGLEYQEHEVVARLEGFWFNANLTEFVMWINLTDSNLRTTLGTTNVVSYEELVSIATSYFAVGAYTRIDHQALVGYFDTLEAGVTEGSGARLDPHTIWQNGVVAKQNFVQIFRSKPLEITGTRLACGSYRIDDIQKNRDKMFQQYNAIKSNHMLWGKQSQKLGANGRPVRTMSGIFDYGLHQIRYMRSTLNMSSAANYSEVIEDWLNNIAYSYVAFMEKTGNKVITLGCCHDMLRNLSKIVKLSYGQQPNVYGTQPAMHPSNPSSVDFSVKHFDFISAYGITLRFIHVPEFDMMTNFKLPYHLVGTGVKPRNLIIALDKEYLSTVVLRPDKLQGNIQGADEDLTREDILGECTLELLYDKNHAVIICDII
jgi:hypothetical protein